MKKLFGIIITFALVVFFNLNVKSQSIESTNDSIDFNGYSLINSRKLSNQRFFLYGSIDSILNKNEVKVSDFYFRNDSLSMISNESIFLNKWDREKSLPNNAYIRFADSLLEITFYITLMNGPNWEVNEVPILTQSIILRHDVLCTSRIDLVFNYPVFDKDEGLKTFQEFENLHLFYKKSPILNDVTVDTIIDLMGRLLLQSLAGDKKSEEIFLNLPKAFPKWFSGIVAEIYSEQRSSFLYITQVPFMRRLR